jgi:predicted ATPase
LSVEAFRLQNFMPFEDTGWIELKPICLLFGRNSSGKSAIIRALRFLRQSLSNTSPDTPFIYYTEHGVDVGDYKTLVHRQQVARNMKFSFRCTFEDTLEEIRKSVNTQRVRNQLSPISARDFTPWVEFKLTYSWSDADTQAQLTEFQIAGPWNVGGQDNQTCIIFGAQWLPSSATVSEDEWWFWSDVLLGHEIESETAWYGVSIESIYGFLPSFAIPRLKPLVDSSSFQDLELVSALLEELCEDIYYFLNTIEYIGPIRPQPQRVYAFDPLTSLRWEQLGWGAFLRFLKGDLDQIILQQIADWMQKLDLGNQIVPDKKNYTGDLAVVTEVKVESAKNTWINLVDTGYGAGQVLPIIVECVLAERDVLVIIEQPELHLHPRAQAQLADLLIEVATRGKQLIEQRKMAKQSLPTRDELKSLRVRFLVETHSEHVLLRLRRRVAETTAQLPISRDAFSLSADDAGVFFVSRTGNSSSLNRVAIKPLGDMEALPETLSGFFSDDLSDMVYLTEAAIKSEKR